MFPILVQKEILAESEAALYVCARALAVPAFHTPGRQAAYVGQQLLQSRLRLSLPGPTSAGGGWGRGRLSGNTTILSF